MAPAGSDVGSGGRRHVLCGDAPLEEVRVSVEGLTGTARAAALAAADAARGARTLRGLDDALRGDAALQMNAAAQARGSSLRVEVSPGPKKGVVDVAFRASPPTRGAWCFATQAGLEERLDSTLSMQLEHAIASTDDQPPVRFGCGGVVNVANQAVTGTLRIRPSPLASAPHVQPALEIGMGGSNLLGCAPQQTSCFGALSVVDPTGRHSLRLQANLREYLQTSALKLPLKTTQASLGYRFLEDTRFAASEGSGDLGPGDLFAASAELALGGEHWDTASARTQAIWTRSRRVFSRGLFSLSAAGGLAVPLADVGVLPLEDRFFLGGTAGPSPGERMPGFQTRGLGTDLPASSAAQKATAPAAQPAQAASEEEPPVEPVTRWSFDGLFRSKQREVSSHERRAELDAASAMQAQSTSFDSMGGAARASLTATLLMPLPMLAGFRMQGMLTGTAGALADEVRPTLVQDLAGQARASVAACVATALPGGGLLGVSLAHALVKKDGDKVRGLQLWLSFGQSL